jgi:hypothetical protein
VHLSVGTLGTYRYLPFPASSRSVDGGKSRPSWTFLPKQNLEITNRPQLPLKSFEEVEVEVFFF